MFQESPPIQDDACQGWEVGSTGEEEDSLGTSLTEERASTEVSGGKRAEKGNSAQDKNVLISILTGFENGSSRAASCPGG